MAYRSGRSSPIPPARSYAHASTASASQCSFEWDVARCAYALKAEYQPNFIEFLKAKIPGSDRAWDPSTKTWYIKDAWFDILFELASQLWPGAVACVPRAQAEQAFKEQEAARNAMLQAQRAAVLGPFESALLAFCALCDLDSLKASYRKAATQLHPDKAGGDSDKMSKLNAAWYLIEQEFTKKSQEK